MSIITDVDSYKLSHFLQYPPGTEYVSSYIEARTGGSEPYILYFGLQMWIKKVLETQITDEDIEEAEIILKGHGLPFNREGWEIIVDEFDGILPIRIQTIHEGTVVKRGTPLVQITNTDPRFFWLVSYLETSLLRAIWYPTTVATKSWQIKRVIKSYLDKTSDNVEASLPFMLHDFGSRGVSSKESAGIGGVAHLVNFKGTDTLEAIDYAQLYYGAEDEAPAFSVPASEHSTITSWGQDREADAYENMIDKFGDGIVSIVSDSYDLFNAIDNIYGDKLKQKILDMKGRLVIRPDSGDPLTIVLETVTRLDNIFGSALNSKGFKVMNPKIRVLQGDGVNLNTIGEILNGLWLAGYSAENVVFGMGGELLQKVNRDTYRFAMKANAIKFAGSDEWVPVCKKPATDPSKASKAGRIPDDQFDGIAYHYEKERGFSDIEMFDPTLEEIRKRSEVF